jgi:hypothetical protein
MKVEKKTQNPTGTYHTNLVIWFFFFLQNVANLGHFSHEKSFFIKWSVLCEGCWKNWNLMEVLCSEILEKPNQRFFDFQKIPKN